MEKIQMEDIVNYCKQYGFVFQGSEIYGGLANTWDYGPLGVELKENIRKAWWKKFIQEHPYNYGINTAILMNPKVWEATGHVSNFTDPLTDCKKCKTRHRADSLVLDADSLSNEELEKAIKKNKVKCPKCDASDFTPVRNFNMLFKTFQGVTDDSVDTIYLRPETAQGMFVNFNNVLRTMRAKIPFGIGQTGKSFRNEITPGNFMFRTREFEQMELQFFCKPGDDLKWFGYYKNFCMNWLKDLGIKSDDLRFRDHSKEELSFYSVATTDIEYNFPTGWGELWGIADRTDYDLSTHKEHSGVDLSYLDPETNERYIPYVIEPALGLDRTFLTILCNGYKKELLPNHEIREVLSIHPFLAPYKVTILPLIKKLHSSLAMEIYSNLCNEFHCNYDEAGSIGKRYRRSDAIGTPFAITIDDETINNGTVTIRDRDTMKQEEIKIEELPKFINEHIKF